MYQIAKGQFLNPRNSEILNRLMRRGVVSLQPAPRLTSGALAGCSPAPSRWRVLRAGRRKPKNGVWQSIQVPLLIVLLLLIALLAYTGGEVFNALAAVLGSTAVVAGNVFRIFGLARGSGAGIGSMSSC